MIPKRRPVGPWYGDERQRVRFEGQARRLPQLMVRREAKRDEDYIVYSLPLDLPGCGRKDVEIHVANRSFRHIGRPRVYAGGCERYRHLHEDKSLCIWDPRDEASRRWIPADGLQQLIDLAAAHIYREEYCLRTGEWLGDEVPHDADTRKEVDKA